MAVCCCERFAQLAKQPRVLDGDDGLSGEVLDQLDLLVRERLNHRPCEHERTNWNTVSQQRDTEIAAVATQFLAFGKNIFGVG